LIAVGGGLVLAGLGEKNATPAQIVTILVPADALRLPVILTRLIAHAGHLNCADHWLFAITTKMQGLAAR
jgi:hypothetical protein